MVVNHSETCGLKTSTVNQELNIVGEALPGGLRQGETYTFRMWASANGATYQSGVGSFTIKDVQQPVISDISVSDVSETGYTVHITIRMTFCLIGEATAFAEERRMEIPIHIGSIFQIIIMNWENISLIFTLMILLEMYLMLLFQRRILRKMSTPIPARARLLHSRTVRQPE